MGGEAVGGDAATTPAPRYDATKSSPRD